MKKFLWFITTIMLIIAPMTALASNNEGETTKEETLYSEKELQEEELLDNDYKFENVKVDGTLIEEPKVEINSILEDATGKELNEIEGKNQHNY